MFRINIPSFQSKNGSYLNFTTWTLYLFIRKLPKEQSIAMVEAFIDEIFIAALTNAVQSTLCHRVVKSFRNQGSATLFICI